MEKKPLSFYVSCVCSWDHLLHLSPPSSGVAAHLFVQPLQLHLQGLQEALPIDQLALSSSQSLVALLHLVLHILQLHKINTGMHTHMECMYCTTCICVFPLT